MWIHLVKKDFLLVRKYWIVMLIGAVALPVWIRTRTDFIAGGFLSFAISTLYIQYLLFNAVSLIEFKYKGSALLCATPYTRKATVLAKYAFLAAVYVGCCLVYTLTALLLPGRIEMLRLSDIALSLLIASAIFGVLIPVQYRFGYDRSKLFFFFLLFLLPFVLPAILKWWQNREVALPIALMHSQTLQAGLLGLLAIAIGWLSARISVGIYSARNL